MDKEVINAKLTNFDNRINDVCKAIREMRDEFMRDAERFEMDVHSYHINKGEEWCGAIVHIAGNNHTLEEAKEFHRKFGILLELAEKGQ